MALFFINQPFLIKVEQTEDYIGYNWDKTAYKSAFIPILP